MSDAKAKPAKKAAPKKPAEHPKYIEMIAASIAALKERSNTSKPTTRLVIILRCISNWL